MSNDVTIHSYSKAALWEIVQKQGRVIHVIGEVLTSPMHDDARCRAELLNLLTTLNVIPPQEKAS